MTIEQENPITEQEEISETVSEETPEEVNEEQKNYPTQAVLTIRIVVGIYVAYLAYQIVTSKDEITTLMWVAVAVFVVAAVGLIAMSIKHFICGEYEGGEDRRR